MNKKLNFTKLTSKKKNVEPPADTNASKQQTISKFFFPQKQNEDAFDKIRNEPQKRVAESSSRDVPEKKLKVTDTKNPLSDGIGKKLQIYSIDNANVNSPTKTRTPIVFNSKEENVNGTDNSKENTKKNQSQFTPLEKQFLEIKEQNPDLILFVECGYKFRFFDKDAEVAAKELNICCHINHNFQTASIPTHRLFVHVRRLVAKGYKVGVVKQTETSAIKAVGTNKSGPFTRELSAIYTKATMIGEDVDLRYDQELLETQAIDDANYVMCVCEYVCKKAGFNIGIIACRPSTGDILFDYFDDNSTRIELENRISHLQPSEIIIPANGLSAGTKRLIEHYVANSEESIRIEEQSEINFDYVIAITNVTKFFENQTNEGNTLTGDLQTILSLPAPVVCCLAALINYMKQFHLDKILVFASHGMEKFSEKNRFLNLNATTVRNLELFNNLTNGKNIGTLLSHMNRTKTAFGARLLKKWISCPLQNIKEIENRQEAVTEFLQSSSPVFNALKAMLHKIQDLEKQLGCCFHNRCSTTSFFLMLKTFSNIEFNLTALKTQIDGEIQSEYLKNILIDLISSLNGIADEYLSNINEKAARDNNKTNIFKDFSLYPEVISCQVNIQETIQALKDERKSICKVLRLPGFDYSTVGDQEFLIEVRNAQLKGVPKDWIQVNSTKQAGRYRSPEVQKLVVKLTVYREELSIACNNAWNSYINDFNKHYYQFSGVVKKMAILDCLISLSEVAKQTDYCRPLLVEHENVLHIEDGRHPITSLYLPDGRQYIANDTLLDAEKRCTIITGPNMGGKSSYLRQVSLIVIMAHIGSYVPAKAAVMSLIDGIYTRMGASDEMYKNRSTFLLELQEVSETMKQATSNSLVILDELGRGTSTHDGTAIAYASLNYFLNDVKCFTLYVTHYTILCEFENKYPKNIINFHMAFLTENSGNATEENVIFLYKLKQGVASGSFGLNVAQLAGIPLQILNVAAIQSKKVKDEFERKKKLRDVFRQLWNQSNVEENIKHLYKHFVL